MVDISKIQEAEVVETEKSPLDIAIEKIDVLAETLGSMNTRLTAIEEDQAKLNDNQQKLVDHVNGWVGNIDSVDQAAFIANYIHFNGELGKEITKEKVKKTQTSIGQAFTMLGEYRKVLEAEVAESKKKLEKKKPARKSKKNVGNQDVKTKKNTKSK